MTTAYTNDLRLAEMATGENAGTWGNTTNTNLELIAEAFGYGTENLGSDANTTITMADGSTDAVRSIYLKITSTSLSATREVTLAPNTVSKIWIIENATTGSQSITIKQGSGGTVTIPNGANKIVVTDGAGSGAAVFDALSDIDIDSGTIDGVIIGGSSAAAGNFTTLDATGDITGATFTPDGDTSAGDSAAVGFTSAEGLILTGQGSTNDVTIKNDADADVLTIATGGTSVDIVGDVTASTVNADGDTSAGDNAAMGYTAAEGLILTGQGSTNDVTIKNDADADVIEIPTGTTNVTIAGQLNGGTIILAETDTDTSNTGSVTIDFSAHQNFVLTLTGNVTLANPSTESVGQAGVFVFIQDGTGSRTLSLGTDYETVGGAGITLSTAANAVDVVPYFVKASGSIQLGAPQLAFS
jgi:hypothetical protein